MDFQTLSAGLKILDTTPVGAGGVVLNANFTLLDSSLSVLNSATSSPTGSALAKRDSLGGIQFVTVNATTIDGVSVQGDTVSAEDISATNSILINTGSASVSLLSGAVSFKVADPDTGTAYFSVSSLGVVTGASFAGVGSSLTALSGTNISSGTVADARLSANAQSAISTRHAAVTIGTANGLSPP